MTQLDEDLARLVHDDAPYTGVADTARMIRAGSRLRRRRQLAVTAGVGLAAAAVIAPFMLLGSSGDKVGLSPASSPAPASASSPASSLASTASPSSTPDVTLTPDEVKSAATLSICGVASCHYGSPERGELIGAQLEMGTFSGGTEVLYAARGKGFDTSTGKPLASVDYIAAGLVVDGRLRRTVWSFQPDTDPMVGPLGLYGGEHTLAADGRHQYGVFGYVQGEHTSVTATSADGQSHPVTGLSTDVLPGYTVFYDTGAWDAAWGERAEITYGVPGGASCSLEKCGTVG